jgi:phage shock protein C
MYCTSCGTQLQDIANFCSECGCKTGRATPPPQGAPRRLYRLAYDKKLAGVCAGLAKYLDVDVTLVRIAMVAAFFCSGGMALLAYIVASFIMPVDYGVPVHVPTEAHATS